MTYADVFEQFEGGSAGATITSSNTDAPTVGMGGKFAAGGVTGQYARADNGWTPAFYDIDFDDSTTTIAADAWTVRAKFKITDTFSGSDVYYMINGFLGEVGQSPVTWSWGAAFNYKANYRFGDKAIQIVDDNGSETAVDVSAHLGTWIDVIFQGIDGAYGWTILDDTGATIANGTRPCTPGLFRAQTGVTTYHDDDAHVEYGIDDLYMGASASDPMPEPTPPTPPPPATVVTGTSQQVTFSVGPGYPEQPGELVVIAMDKTLSSAPTSLAVSVSGAVPLEELSFKIDGTEVYVANANGDGTLQQISIPVRETYGAGEHTVRVDSSTTSGEDTFTLRYDPDLRPILQGSDVDPVAIPEAQVSDDFYKWVLQDLVAEGLGSWVMPINPSAMTSPGIEKTVTVQHSTAVETGQFHIWRGGDQPISWQFSGYCPNEEFYAQLVAYAGLTRRFYIIDHRNRAWKAIITGLDMVARKRGLDEDGTEQDWRHDYTATAVIYEETPRTPV